MLRFYHGIAQAELGLHLASIASLDSVVRLILAALLDHGRHFPEPAKIPAFPRARGSQASIRLSMTLSVSQTARK
jgi:hypothetical protein